MTSTDVELEQQLKELGNQLSHPSDSVDELLRVLDQVEKILLKVDQSSKKSMLDAVRPSLNRLFKHSDMDVKVAVASCINEITRIIFPEALYTVTSAKRKHDTDKDEVTIKYDESLVGTKVKVWWPVDKMYYEGVVDKYYPDKKKHKISYVDGDIEVLSLKTQNWEILQEFSICDYKGQSTKAQIEETSPEIHKKKKSKTHPSTSPEKIKDSANKVQKKTMNKPSKFIQYTEEDMMTRVPAELRQKLFESVQVEPSNVRQAWSEVPLEKVLAVAPKKATLKELFFFTMLAAGALPANVEKIMNTIEATIQTETTLPANGLGR